MDAKTVELLVPWLGSGAVTLIIAASALYRYLVVQGRDDTKEMQSARQALSADQKMLFDQLRAEIERKTARTLDLERARKILEEDRDRGWNLARECDDRLHDMRHEANNRIFLAWIAGQKGEDAPEPLPTVPPLQSMAGKPPP